MFVKLKASVYIIPMYTPSLPTITPFITTDAPFMPTFAPFNFFHVFYYIHLSRIKQAFIYAVSKVFYITVSKLQNCVIFHFSSVRLLTLRNLNSKIALTYTRIYVQPHSNDLNSKTALSLTYNAPKIKK